MTAITAPPKKGQPRSPADAAALQHFNERMALPRRARPSVPVAERDLLRFRVMPT